MPDRPVPTTSTGASMRSSRISGCAASVACTSSRLTSARTISLRARMRPSRCRSASSSSARRKMRERLAPARRRRSRRGRSPSRAASSSDASSSATSAAGDPSWRPNAFSSRDPFRARLRRPHHASDVAGEHRGAPRAPAARAARSASTIGMRGRKVLARRRRAARPRTSGVGRDRVPIERYTSIPSGWPSVSIQLGTPGSSCATTSRIRPSSSTNGLRHVQARLAVGEVAGVEPVAMVHGPAPVVGVGDVGRDEQAPRRAELPPARAVRDRSAHRPSACPAARPRCAGAMSRARSTYVHQYSIDRSTQVAARSSASPSSAPVTRAGGTPRVSTRSMVSVAARSCSQSQRYWRTRNRRASGCDAIQLRSWRSGEIQSSNDPSGPTSRSSSVHLGEHAVTAEVHVAVDEREERGAHAGDIARSRDTSRRDRSRHACRRCRDSGRPTAPTALRNGGTMGLAGSANSSSPCSAITSWRVRCRRLAACSSPDSGNGAARARADRRDTCTGFPSRSPGHPARAAGATSTHDGDE